MQSCLSCSVDPSQSSSAHSACARSPPTRPSASSARTQVWQTGQQEGDALRWWLTLLARRFDQALVVATDGRASDMAPQHISCAPEAPVASGRQNHDAGRDAAQRSYFRAARGQFPDSEICDLPRAELAVTHRFLRNERGASGCRDNSRRSARAQSWARAVATGRSPLRGGPVDRGTQTRERPCTRRCGLRTATVRCDRSPVPRGSHWSR
jgi:hypothetical protein